MGTSDSSHANIFVEGTVYNADKKVDYTGDFPKLPNPPETGQPLQIAASDAVINSALLNFWPELNLEITEVPEGLPITLDTTGLLILIPQLAKTYGRGVPVSLTITPDPNEDQIPTFATKKGGIDAEVAASIEFKVNPDGKGFVHAVTLYGILNIEADASVDF